MSCEVYVNSKIFVLKFQEQKGKYFSLEIEGIRTKLRLKASSIQEANEWVSFFKEMFQAAKDFKEENSHIIEKRDTILKVLADEYSNKGLD
jgi:hypothetical protein